MLSPTFPSSCDSLQYKAVLPAEIDTLHDNLCRLLPVSFSDFLFTFHPVSSLMNAKKAATNSYVHNCPHAVLLYQKNYKSAPNLLLLCTKINPHTSNRSLRCPHRNCTVILWLDFKRKSRSIIITDMLHRPAHLLCILSGSYRSMPLLQWNIFHSETNRNRHVMAHLHSGYTYPHVLYVSQYSVFINWTTTG